jgi:hypothetical protein
MLLTTLGLTALTSALLAPLQAREIRATNGGYQAVSQAVNSASAGDVVVLPAGDFTYAPTQCVKVTKGITIMGAGDGRTILHKTGASGNDWEPVFKVVGSSADGVRFSDMAIVGSTPKASPGIMIANGSHNFRIHHMTFRHCSEAAVDIRGDCRGVIDHNSFIDNWAYSVVVYGSGNASWSQPLQLGTANAVFIEDNYFRQASVNDPGRTHHIASNNGSRYVFRHNQIDDGNLNSQAIDAHGFDYWPRGSRSYEVYNNTVKVGKRWLACNIRGGDGVIFNNQFSGTYAYGIMLQDYGAREKHFGYPAKDQIRDLYIWNNTLNGAPLTLGNIIVRETTHIKLGRDFRMQARPGYRPYTYPHPLASGGGSGGGSADGGSYSSNPDEGQCGAGAAVAFLPLFGIRLYARKKRQSRK